MAETIDLFDKTASEHRRQAEVHMVSHGTYSANYSPEAVPHAERTKASAYAHQSSARAVDTGLFADHDRAAHAHEIAAKKSTGSEAEKHNGYAAWHRKRAGFVSAAKAIS